MPQHSPLLLLPAKPPPSLTPPYCILQQPPSWVPSPDIPQPELSLTMDNPQL